MKEIIELLKEKKEKVSVMESCTGGYISNAITMVSGSSNVFEFGAVTYSNTYKEKLGVPKEVIDTYTVYSKECASSMAKAISHFTESDYGISATGKLNEVDPFNPYGENNQVYLSIYDKKKEIIKEKTISIVSQTRLEAKEEVLKELTTLLLDVLKNQ